MLQDRVFSIFSHEGAVFIKLDRPETSIAVHGRFRSDGRGAGRLIQ